MFNFENKVVIITGAGSKKGLGREMALEFTDVGAIVVVADLDYEGAKEVASLCEKKGGKAIAVKLNIADPESAMEMGKKVMDTYGKIDILINNAGITQSVSVADMTMDQFAKIITVNTIGTFNCIKAVMEPMKEANYGRIINIASISGKQGGGVFGGAHYCASKAAIIGFSKSFAKELMRNKKYGVTINSVNPGAAATNIRSGISDENEEKILSSIPMQRFATPKDISAAVMYLASDEAAYVTGIDIDVNGGAYMG